MASRLSDDELRQALLEFGENVGPITSTTRSLWEKRLIAMRKSSGISSHSINALSSDDSEIESASAESNKVRKKRNSTRGKVVLARPHVSGRSTPETDVFKKPSPLQIKVPNPKRNVAQSSILRANLDGRTRSKKSRAGKPPGNAFDVETSDSDMDTDGLQISMRTLKLRKRPSLNENSNDGYQLLNQPTHNSAEDRTNLNVSEGRLPLNSWSIEAHPNHGHFHVGTDNSFEGDSSKDDSYSTNGYLSNVLKKRIFHDESIEGSQGLNTNYQYHDSHCVSWMLLFGAIAFFVIIGAVYMKEVQKISQTANKSYPVSKFCSDISKENCNLLLVVSRELHQLLSTVAGEHDCGIGTGKSRNLTILDAKSALQNKIFNAQSFSLKKTQETFDHVFDHTITLILKNPDWGIKLTTSSQETVNDISDLKHPLSNTSALEAIHAAKPLWCRVKHSVGWTATMLLLIASVAGFFYILYFAVKLWNKRKEAQEKLFYELIERVIDIMQETPDSPYQSDTISGTYRVVNHIRDMLIPPKERKEKQWLWDKIEAFIEDNESRIRVEQEKIADEDCKIWRWLPASTSENESGKLGKVWQGQAFNSLGKGKITYNLTPCLKIRNLFDPEVEYGTDWQVSIKDAILEKCEGNEGIVHIAIDTSTNEGCVYMMCVSSEAAGNAFNALHGWWFDGKLVTVKYLRCERYIERFPAAQHCKEPLKPSNNKRLSLSTPFFSSALERS